MGASLVIQLARFGDLLQSKRLLLSLAREGETALAVDRSLVSLARLIYPRARIIPLRAHGGGSAAEILRDNLAACREMRELDPEVVYPLNFSGLSFALAGLFEPERVHGYRSENGQPIRQLWPTMALRWTKRRGMSPLNLVDFWAHLRPAPLPPTEVNPQATPMGGGIGVVLAGRHSRRSLPMEVLARLAMALFEGLGAKRVVLLGSSQERPLARAFKDQAGRRFLGAIEDLAGRTDWPSLIETVGGLDLLLSPDTGTMHLAAHLGTPVLATFLSSAWCFETGPYGLGHQALQAATPCLPCVETEPCRHELACLAPFKDHRLIKALARGEALPEDLPLLRMRSVLDAVGASFEPEAGADAWSERRREMRALVADYLGLPFPSGSAAMLPADARLAETLFHERDWLGLTSGSDRGLPAETEPSPLFGTP